MVSKKYSEPLTFFLIIAFFYLFGGVLLLSVEKSDLHLFINRYHSSITDFIFRWITYLGDGTAAFILAVIFLIRKPKNGLLIGLSALLSGFFVQLLKHSIFSDIVRPSKYFENIAVLYKVPGVELHSFNSFPSGHAATVLAVCFSLALLTNKKSTHAVLAIVALFISFSRVYLSQHFFPDIYFGGLLGLLSVVILVIILDYSEKKGAAWLNRPIIKKNRI